jgi:hypothetical protein
MLISFLTYFSTLKMEATCSSEISAEFQWITRSYVQKVQLFIITVILLRKYRPGAVSCEIQMRVHRFVSRGRDVQVSKCIRTGRPGFGPQYEKGGDSFSSSHPDAISVSSVLTRGFLPGLKLPEPEIDHSSHIFLSEHFPPLSHTSSWYGSWAQDKFTFLSNNP